MKRTGLLLLLGLCLGAGQWNKAKTFRLKDFYPLAPGTRWIYMPPPGKTDYISRVEAGDRANVVRHYDATNAAKELRTEKGKGLFYDREWFTDKSYAVFDRPILWFPAKFQLGDSIQEERTYQKYEVDGKVNQGTFKIWQKIVAVETATLTSGATYPNCLRIESMTWWTFADGRKAQSINVYHYAPKIGPVKAAARFIISAPDGKELINRLVETELKKFEPVG